MTAPANRCDSVHDSADDLRFIHEENAGCSLRWARLAGRHRGRKRTTRTGLVQEQIAGRMPTLSGRGDRTAVIRRKLPTIPGVVDLKPSGCGGMGIVYRGRDEMLGRQVAVKVMWSLRPGCDRDRRRARREAALLSKFSHPNLVTVHTAGEIDDAPFLVMEWVDGPSLQQRAARDRPTPREAARVVHDLALAVAVVHEAGIIHCDIKPENVLLAGQENGSWGQMVPKLADFGLARLLDAPPEITQTATVIGTPAYMAPEQTGLADDLGPVGPAADIHALGGLAFALVTGVAPYDADVAAMSLQRSSRGDVALPKSFRRLPAELRAIIRKCLELQPCDRYATAAELAADLACFLNGLPVRARPLSLAARVGRLVLRRPAHALAAGLAIVLLVTVLGGAAWHVTAVASLQAEIAETESPTGAVHQSTQDVLPWPRQISWAEVAESVRTGGPDGERNLEFVRKLRDEVGRIPAGGDPQKSVSFRVPILSKLSALFFHGRQYDDVLRCHTLMMRVLDDIATVRTGAALTAAARLESLSLQQQCLQRLGRFDEAIASARTAVAFLEADETKMPAGRRRRHLAHQQVLLSMLLCEQQQQAEATRVLGQAIAQLQRLQMSTLSSDGAVVKQQAQTLASAYVAGGNGHEASPAGKWLKQLVTGDAGQPPLSQAQRITLATLLSLGLREQAAQADKAGRFPEATACAQERGQLERMLAQFGVVGES
jgi:hypothetical protein